MISHRGHGYAGLRVLSGERALTIVIGLAILACPCTAVEFAGGTGEPNDPYLIATAEQLLNADFGRGFSHYRLQCDIDLEGWTLPFHRDFYGHLDGAGYKIRHPTIRTEGFFRDVHRTATIRNLTLTNVTVGIGLGKAVGALAAVNGGTITNCGVTGWIISHKNSSMGGLVGVNSGSITDCYFDGWISAHNSSCCGTGGLVGLNYYDGSITGCYATGAVIASTFAASTFAGGLVGSNWGSITNCYAKTMVISEFGGGGLVGDNWGSLRYCYAAGRVFGEMRGGLVGMMSMMREYGGSATNCLWDTDTTLCPTSAAGVGISGHRYMQENWPYSCNGWAGNAYWVYKKTRPWDIGGPESEHAHLVWEGTEGEPIPEGCARCTFSGGTGTAEDPYQITSRGQLQVLGMASIFWDKHFVLTADLDFAGRGGPFWADEPVYPLGTCTGSAFTGTFDGRGHVIRNAIIDVGDDTAWNGGVFGYLTGEVRNLGIENMRIISGQNSRFVGLLAGTCDRGHIENCQASGSVTVGPNSQYIGELVGYSTGEIMDSEAAVIVTAGEGSTDVGGLVGWQAE